LRLAHLLPLVIFIKGKRYFFLLSLLFSKLNNLPFVEIVVL
jgi:hypothetical protein